EVVVRPHRVAGDAVRRGAEGLEFREQGVEVQTLGGAAGRGVLGVEVQHQPAAAVVGEGGAGAAGELQRELEGGAVELVAFVHCSLRMRDQNFIGSMIASRLRWSQNSRKSSRNAAMCMSAGTP